MRNKLLSINNLSKSFKSKADTIKVLDNINLDIYEGDFISIVGSSGCGKSTLLNIIAGLINESNGEINYHYDNLKETGYMMQDAALFPWLTIKKNATFACDIKNKDSSYALNLLKKYGLDDFQNKYPNNISGGMKQRVSLIRTVSSKPKLLLLDEPFSALDYQSRLNISLDVHNLVKENNITTILITHDISEAISLSSKVIVLSKRPATIKNIYNIEIDDKQNPIERRKDNKFSYYYDLIGKDLNIFEK